MRSGRASTRRRQAERRLLRPGQRLCSYPHATKRSICFLFFQFSTKQHVFIFFHVFFFSRAAVLVNNCGQNISVCTLWIALSNDIHPSFVFGAARLAAKWAFAGTSSMSSRRSRGEWTARAAGRLELSYPHGCEWWMPATISC